MELQCVCTAKHYTILSAFCLIDGTNLSWQLETEFSQSVVCPGEGVSKQSSHSHHAVNTKHQSRIPLSKYTYLTFAIEIESKTDMQLQSSTAIIGSVK